MLARILCIYTRYTYSFNVYMYLFSFRIKLIEHLTDHCAKEAESSKSSQDGGNSDLVKVIEQMHSLRNDNWYHSVQGNYSKNTNEGTEDPSLRMPRVNSQGKVKTFRCKQCNFTAVTKLDFWEHSRTHIRAERLLTCPKCPFVTEYKHHLEYHMHNHVGSKPFKCAQCSYSCVNKSMLNSHMKSHSNVYQYRCADCAYVTKYCHSLKLHLRKYLHKPACVLNADGTPNPEPIIDVYGTRRGPKQKPRISVQTSNEMNQGNDHFSANVQTNASIDLEKSDNNNVQSKPIVPSLQQPAAFPAFPSATNGTSDADMREGQNGVNQCQADATTYTYSQLFAAFNVNQFLFRENESLQTEMSSAASTATAANSDGRLPAEELIPQEQSPTTYYDVSDVNELPTASDYSIPGTRANTENDRLLGSSESVPLDLTKANGDCTQRAMTGSPKGTSRRRKGVAVKLEHRLVLEDTDEEATPNDAKSIESPTSSSFGSGANSDSKELEDKAEHWFGDGFVCYYCDICFRNEGMYTVHMGFHGYNEPYTCNMCGFQAADNMSFYLHINRRKGHA